MRNARHDGLEHFCWRLVDDASCQHLAGDGSGQVLCEKEEMRGQSKAQGVSHYADAHRRNQSGTFWRGKSQSVSQHRTGIQKLTGELTWRLCGAKDKAIEVSSLFALVLD